MMSEKHKSIVIVMTVFGNLQKAEFFILYVYSELYIWFVLATFELMEAKKWI